MADHSKTAEHKATIIYQENYNGCSEQREGEREGGRKSAFCHQPLYQISLSFPFGRYDTDKSKYGNGTCHSESVYKYFIIVCD